MWIWLLFQVWTWSWWWSLIVQKTISNFKWISNYNIYSKFNISTTLSLKFIKHIQEIPFIKDFFFFKSWPCTIYLFIYLLFCWILIDKNNSIFNNCCTIGLNITKQPWRTPIHWGLSNNTKTMAWSIMIWEIATQQVKQTT